MKSKKKLNFYQPVSRVLSEYLATEPPARERMGKEKAQSFLAPFFSRNYGSQPTYRLVKFYLFFFFFSVLS